MKKIISPTLDDILFEQGLDHILNSPDEEFVEFAREHNLDLNQLAEANGTAARKALDEHNLKNSATVLKIDPAAVRYRPSKMLTQPVKSDNFVDKLLAKVKAMGLKFKIEYVDSLTENLQHKMAFRSKTPRQSKPRKKPRS